jgi:hypothetical protein
MLKRSPQISPKRSKPVTQCCESNIDSGDLQHPRCVARWDNSTLRKSLPDIKPTALFSFTLSKI